ncbi:hypothetical protein DNTS_035474 [Danionella cerebrum]|uniref:Uncharacterized protein n=1 Tax=Danionella cerebrum TaxID=2873325 RepID=A0A553R644_9TELE|nr:hypothetical protein DNTS_035474 [Danionella translucida]
MSARWTEHNALNMVPLGNTELYAQSTSQLVFKPVIRTETAAVSGFFMEPAVGGDEPACTRWCQGAQTVRTGKREERERENRMNPLPKPEQQ